MLNKPPGPRGGLYRTSWHASAPPTKGNRPVLVHRLDRDTSGVLLIAKSRRWRRSSAKLSLTPRRRLLGAGRGGTKPRRADLDVSRQGRGHGRNARAGRGGCERMRVARRSAQHCSPHAAVDKVTPRRRLSMPSGHRRTHQLRPLRRDRPSDRRDPKYNRRPLNDPARTIRCAVPPGLEPKLHLLARRLSCPIRVTNIDVTAPLRST